MDPLTVSFDRGTLRIDGTSACPFPSAVYDNRVNAWRLPAYRYGPALGWAIQHDTACFDHVEASMAARVDGWMVPPLRNYQEAALRAWTVLDRRGIVVFPTGAGKTRMAIAAVAAERARTLILVPTCALLEQWEHQIRRWYGGPIGVVGDGSHALASITLMTFESAYRHLDEYGDRFKMLVVDEVHHFAGGLRAEALEMCAAPFRLGLTATAPADQTAGAARLRELMGPVVSEVQLEDLTGTHLAELETIILRTCLDEEETKRYQTLVGRFSTLRRAFSQSYPHADWASCIAFILRQRGGSQMLADYHRGCALAAFPRKKQALLASLLADHRSDRTLVFTAGTDDAYAIASAHLIPVITAETNRSERKEILERFAEGRYGAIVSARVLNEGIDVPDARIGIVVAGALGAREHVQRIGRLLRPAPNKRARIYELVTRDTIEEQRSRRRGNATRITSRV